MTQPVDRKLKSFLEMPYERGPKWIDDRHIALIRHDSTGDRLWKVDLVTGERTPLYDQDVRIWNFHIGSSDGAIYYASDNSGSECEQIIKLEHGKTTDLTDDPGVRHLFGGVSPDGAYVAYACNRRTSPTFDIWKMDVKSGERSLLRQFDDHYNWPPEGGMSYDGKYLLYNKLKGESDNALWITDLGSGESWRVPEDDRISAETQPAWKHKSDGFYLLSDRDSEFVNVWYYDLRSREMKLCYEYGWDVEAMCLSADDRYLAVFVNESGYTSLRIYDLLNQTEVALDYPRGVYSSYQLPSWSPRGAKLLMTYESGSHPTCVAILDVETGKLQLLSKEEEATLEARKLLIEPELASYRSFDGLEVPYWLYVPDGVAKNAMPVLIEIHGGPEGQERPTFDAFIQYLVSEGIAVVAPNVRGSTGYGKTYTHLDDVEKRLDSVKDIEFLVRHLVETGIADPARIGVSGTSYGGFMTLSCAARMPKLWACAVDTVGMYDLVTFLENTADYRRPHRESEYGALATHRDFLKSVSPVSKIGDIVAPMMIIQGKNDPRVPVTEAEQAVDALRALGREVEYLCYADEGHGIVKLKNRLDCYPKVATFIKKHLRIGAE
ncbi:MAG: S9 family peptidase [Bacillota bacterium]|nr:S9 family peptidase [Bacillota bacterium]